jgi:putative transposase
MVSEVTASKSKLKPVKTIKIRLFPTKEEKASLDLMLDQYRWYYNNAIRVTHKHIGDYKKLVEQSKYSYPKMRDTIRTYKYTETMRDDGKTSLDFTQDEESKEFQVPHWWSDTKVHSRIPRGAIKKFVGNLNSAVSNYNNNNISSFTMKFRSRKEPTAYMLFEDKGYPSLINKIKSHYWFRKRSSNHRNTRESMTLSNIIKSTLHKGLEIIHDKQTDKYFIHYPVEQDWFPDTDIRNEKQVEYAVKGNRVISLDPGIRKFLVGYDPLGTSVFIGESANKKLIHMLYILDKLENKDDQHRLWTRIKNLVSELHWKSISYLVKHYDTIILPDFRTQQMLRSKTLSKMTKRIMSMYSFHVFKERLTYMCKRYNKTLYIVDESYTSCTCGSCGYVNPKSSNEKFTCKICNVKMDRDVNGARNILIKNV